MVIGASFAASVRRSSFCRVRHEWLTFRSTVQDDYLEQGIAIIANPEAGELFTLEREERRKVLQICIEEAAGRCPVIAGVVHVHTKGYIETAKDAREL